MKSILSQYDVINKIRNLKQDKKFIRKYYERINNFFIIKFDYRNKTKNVTFFEKNLIWLTFVIEKWIRKIKSIKFFDYFANKFVKNLFDAYIIAKRKMLKKKRKRRQKQKRKFQKKYQMILQQFQKFVDRDFVVDVVRIQKFYEFSFILKRIRLETLEINTIIVNSSDTNSIDEIFVSKSDKWIVFAKMKIFDYINTFDEIAKNSFAFDIKISNISFDWNSFCILKILNEKIFVLIVVFDVFFEKFVRIIFRKSENFDRNEYVVFQIFHEHEWFCYWDFWFWYCNKCIFEKFVDTTYREFRNIEKKFDLHTRIFFNFCIWFQHRYRFSNLYNRYRNIFIWLKSLLLLRNTIFAKK